MLVLIIVSCLDQLMKNFFLVQIPFLHFQILGFLFLSHMHLLFVPLDEIVFLAFSDGLYRDKNLLIGNFTARRSGQPWYWFNSLHVKLLLTYNTLPYWIKLTFQQCTVRVCSRVFAVHLKNRTQVQLHHWILY